MRIKKTLVVGIVMLCVFALLATPANAAGNDLGGLTLAASLDSSGETIKVEIAVAAYYKEGIYVDVSADLVSAQADSYIVFINGKSCPMQYDCTWDDIGIAEFTVDDSNNSLGAAGAAIASKDEQMSLVYYYSSGDSLDVGTAKIQITGYRNTSNGIILYDYELLESMESDYAFPMSVINTSGQVVAYVTDTGSDIAVYTYVFDEAAFSGVATEPSQPAGSNPSSSSQPGTPSRDPVIDDPNHNQKSAAEYVPFIGIGAIIVFLISLFVLRICRKMGRKTGGTPLHDIESKKKDGSSNVSGTATPVNDPYQPTTPTDISPAIPIDIPPAVPTPAALQKVTPVVYGVGGAMDGRRYTITQTAMTIGREKSCHICYPASTPGVSHRHCVLSIQNGVLMLMDNNSTYGTYLQGTGQLTPQQPVALKDGDVFYLGEKKNAFRLTFE